MRKLLCYIGIHKWIANYDWRTQHFFTDFCEHCNKEKKT
jgi:hypothetical protein